MSSQYTIIGSCLPSQVTLVYNVNVYGIDEAEFAHQIQVGVAASTSVGPAEHKPQGTTQVLVQGNQVAFIGKLLLGKMLLLMLKLW